MGIPTNSIERQLAVVPVVYGDKKPRVVLVSRSSQHRWVFPKGRIEPDVTEVQQASIEAFEEAGIIGRISLAPIGAFSKRQGGRLIVVSAYPFVVDWLLKKWPEHEYRERIIVSRKQASRLLDLDASALIKPSLRWIQDNHLTMRLALPNAEQVVKDWPAKKRAG